MTRQMWEIEIRHEGLNKYRHIRGSDRNIVVQKAAVQELKWKEEWGKKQVSEQIKREKFKAAKNKEMKIDEAVRRTEAAEVYLASMQNTLKHTLSVNDVIDWELLINHDQYRLPEPVSPELQSIPAEPFLTDDKYEPQLGLFDKIFKNLKAKRKEEANTLFLKDHSEWSATKLLIDTANQDALNSHQKNHDRWLRTSSAFYEKQRESNDAIRAKKQSYLAGDAEAIVDYCDMVLSNSEYPETFPQNWDLEYQAETNLLVVDYSLPSPEAIDRIKSVKYVATRDEMVESYITDAALKALYDDLLYQMALRSIHEIFEADVINGIASICFNGWVDSIDKATGNRVNACIMSISVSKDEFLAINLELIDPKLCFKQLKGVGSSKLHGLTPVAPIMTLNKEDRRFVSAYEVINGVEEGDNLAAMDWQDFENLIRELFEKEFSTNGGEVKITQASRDGGVDAIAFDPDPIRGGKIVIQAKRYTNVVGVSAVRDLFGTTVNEGATKGILVTTANFGPDAYEFAKGKPLTLLNGSNLLHLLDKHGHTARIDLQEAKLKLRGQ
ncbi:restriction endonuclease [Shewanella xiamenensis]|uniref:restriction endonuclease n=1 Tax=Shewanella xiamenensis TaxID=332186 RepID=UPI00055FEA3D|nr:restriction endonuclease [Shewanella xiamenensis]